MVPGRRRRPSVVGSMVLVISLMSTSSMVCAWPGERVPAGMFMLGGRVVVCCTALKLGLGSVFIIDSPTEVPPGQCARRLSRQGAVQVHGIHAARRTAA